MKNFFQALNYLEKRYSKNEKIEGYFEGQKERYIVNFGVIKKYLKKSDKILDIGSLPPYFLAALSLIGFNIEGVDKLLNREKKLILKEKLKLKKCDIEKDLLPFPNSSFDKIIFSEVFEHLYVNPIFSINEMKRVLKKKGLLILTTPNGYSLKRILKFVFGRGLGEEPFEEFYKLNKFGYRGHIREYSLKEVKYFLRKCGFKILKCYYITCNHKRFENNFILRNIFALFYKIFFPFRTHLIVIANK